MKTFLLVVIPILSVFTAIGLACAVRIGLRRGTQPDPFATPFGEVPIIDMRNSPRGYTAEQLARLAPPVNTTDPLRRSFVARSPHTVWPRYGAGCTMRDASNPAGLALRADADGGRPVFASWLASIGNFFKARRHA